MRAEQILPQMSLLVLLLMFDNEGHSRLAEGKTLQKVSSFTSFWNQDRLHLVLLPVKCPKSEQILRNPPKWLNDAIATWQRTAAQQLCTQTPISRGSKFLL